MLRERKSMICRGANAPEAESGFRSQRSITFDGVEFITLSEARLITLGVAKLITKNLVNSILKQKTERRFPLGFYVMGSRSEQ